jgi:hypothetical protein
MGLLPGVGNITDSNTRRDSPGNINCKNTYTLNYNDLIAAQQGLEGWFQNGSSYSSKQMSYKSASANAYSCNYGNV